MNQEFNITEEYAIELDRKDELAKYRDFFFIPESIIYLNGNSLGLMCKESHKNILNTLELWKNLGVNAWFEGNQPWFYYAEKIGAMAAKLVGARSDEVIATGTTTINIHSLISTFYKPESGRKYILSDVLDFPTDIYALKGQIKIKGLDPEKYLILSSSQRIQVGILFQLRLSLFLNLTISRQSPYIF